MLDAAHGKTGGTVPRFEWVNVVCVEVQIAHFDLVGSKRRGRERVPVRADVRQGSRRFVAVARSRAISNRWNGCRGEGTKQNSQFTIHNAQLTPLRGFDSALAQQRLVV